jgi:hypothetical protein
MKTYTIYDPVTMQDVVHNVNPLNRLTPEVYADLAKQFRLPIPNATTTPIEVGYALGVQAVLQKLREGWVIEQ